MEQDLLSVIVPIFNVERYLPRCIDSIINQQYRNIEIILVDDGSSDNSAKICDTYEEKDTRIKVIHQKNRGLIGARYTGLLSAKATYVAFVDGDDWIDEYIYAVLMQPIIEYKVESVTSGYTMFWNDDKKVMSTDQSFKEGIYDKDRIQKCLIPRMLWNEHNGLFPLNTAMWNKIFLKEKLLEVYEELSKQTFYYAEDVAAFYPYILKTNSMYILHESHYFYRQRTNERAPYFTSDHFFDELFKLYMYLRQAFSQNENKKTLLNQLEHFYVLAAQHRFPPKENIETKWLFPFEIISKGENIILYGAGRVGKILKRQVEKTKYCNIVLWVDKNYMKYADNVLPIEDMMNRKFDKVVIAVADKQEEIRRELTSLGIEEKRIVMVDSGK